jgi:hypothetical protein
MTTSSRRRASIALGGLALATILFCGLLAGRGVAAAHLLLLPRAGRADVLQVDEADA